MRTLLKCVLVFAVVCTVAFLPSGRTNACCGQLIDIYQCTVEPVLLNACDGDEAAISGLIYEYYWNGGLNQWPMAVTVTLTDASNNVVRTFQADVTQTFIGGSYGVDDDGDGLVDEDPGYPVDGVDDDNDGRIDEDGGYWGDEYADFSFAGVWDCMDEFGEMVPQGVYLMTITAQAGQMGTTSVFVEVATSSEEPCCVEGGSVNITPETINKKSKGKWITAHVVLPDGYTSADLLGGKVISIDGMPVDIGGEAKGNGVVKFPRDDVIGYLPDVPEGPAGHGKDGRVEDVVICIELSLFEDAVSCGLCDTVDVIH